LSLILAQSGRFALPVDQGCVSEQYEEGVFCINSVVI